MNSRLSSEHHTEHTLEAKPVWADSEAPSADAELSLQDAAHVWLRVTAAPPAAKAEPASWCVWSRDGQELGKSPFFNRCSQYISVQLVSLSQWLNLTDLLE